MDFIIAFNFLCRVFFCYGLRYKLQVTLKPLFIHVHRVTQPFQYTMDGICGSVPIINRIGIDTTILILIDANTSYNPTESFPQIVFPTHARRQFCYLRTTITTIAILHIHRVLFFILQQLKKHLSDFGVGNSIPHGGLQMMHESE